MNPKMLIERYTEMRDGGFGAGMLVEVEWMFLDMARGGDADGIREQHYAGKPYNFFQEVCDGMGWDHA